MRRLDQPVRLRELVEALGGELHGDGDCLIWRLASLTSAGQGDLSFLADARLRQHLPSSGASALILAPDMRSHVNPRLSVIATPDPALYFARLTQWWKRRQQSTRGPLVHPSAVVEDDVQLGDGVRIGALSYIGRGASIGANTVIQDRVTVGAHCVLGARCLVLSGAVIGGDGFGFARDGSRWVRIEQLGAVRIGNDVEVGANTCIDRGALDDTVIGDGVKLDNLIQIGHNCHIGENTAMAGCVGVAGSARIGARCTVGGAGMILGHLSIADDVHISSASIVTRSIHKAGHYTGFFPLDDNASWEKNAATIKHVHTLRKRLQALEQTLADRPSHPG